MKSKIFLKIGIILISIILIYILFIIFVISPKISKYLIDLEIKQAKTQLDRISTVINSKERYLRDFHQARVIKHKKDVVDITLTADTIIDNYYKMYKNNILSKENVIKYSLETISEINHDEKYIFILDTNGTFLLHPDKKFNKKNIYSVGTPTEKKNISNIIRNSINLENTYNKYRWLNPRTNSVSEKISYSKYLKSLDIIVSSGTYIENIREEIKEEKEKIIKELNPLIKSIVLGEVGYIFIINGKNITLSHPNKNLINKDISKLKEYGTNKLIVNSIKESYEKNKPWVYKWNKPTDLKNFDYEKMTWIKYNKFFDWYIGSSVYKDDLEYKSKEINKMVMQFSLFLLICMIFIAILFIKKLLKPISLLSKNAHLVENGNFKVRNKITTNDELGVLSNHFDRMLDYIEDNTKNLEQKVNVRTAELEYKLYHDELTGLKNRISLSKNLENKEFHALSLIDIDEFNSINELYGFDVGNEVLVEVSSILKEFSSQRGIELYKLDSDIFAILDKNITKFTSYDNFLEELQNLFKNKEIHIDSLEIDIYVYITIGTSISQNESIKTANIALKRAKKKSYKYMVYNQEIDTKENIQKTMYWRAKIKDAMENNKLVAFYQPIYNESEELVKYETLMRISEEQGGEIKYISPGFFLDIAIKTKQYFKLNELVIEKSLKNLEKIDKSISVNISFADIQNLEFVEALGENVKKLTKEQRNRLVFEILESDFISDYKVLDEFILEYRRQGIKIAIDDFGTGYSNFSHILKIKPDYIKIDGSLIKDLDTDKHSYEIVKSIINFSHSLGIKVIAEFIHNKEIYKIVKELKVDEFQGFYLGEPKLLIE